MHSLPQATALNSLRRRLLQSHKLNVLRSRLHGWLNPCAEPRLGFIFGCQRSGTTLLRSFIGLDWRVSDQGEGDPPYFWQLPVSEPKYLRLRDDADIETLRQRERSELVLLKPLHDTQRAHQLLQTWPQSRAVFIHRHYREVILSHLHYYRRRYDPDAYLADLLSLNPQSWKAENLDEPTRDFIAAHRHLASNPSNGFALFWLARNSLRFSQDHARMIGLHYADLVRHPHFCLQQLGRLFEMDFPPQLALLPETRERSAPLPDTLHPQLEQACEDMLCRLNAHSLRP